MALLDEDEDLFSERGGNAPPTHERGGQQILMRRLVALGFGVGVLILLVLGVRGCLNARQERAFKDYVRDIQALTEESAQISDDFFSGLESPGDVTPLDFQSEVNANRGQADVLVGRVKKLDPPNEMERAQQALVLVFELRRDALRAIGADLDTALGREGRSEATGRIAGQMQAFLASDVIYSQRAFPEIERALRREGIGDVKVPASQFLPEIDWLTPVRVSEALAKVRGRTGGRAAAPGIHGMGLTRVLATPGDVLLGSAAPAELRAGGEPGLSIEVQNQGESEEADVAVTVSVTGGARPIDLERSIDRIAAGETKTVNIPISPAPARGQQVKVKVEVLPVPGEKVTDNNTASFTVTYR